ncbi:lantibiotic dehydratase [Echinicola marina]|uniref:lantibiotic dehydratase n=1 Tax=Echinicola marina TaxID=2859768 RepID=UPI001CF6DC95|nr:lantibiotic dehydratase [Echinicola marina]UCS92398.1 lantibiotic dehydratase [Echinicola marina]
MQVNILNSFVVRTPLHPLNHLEEFLKLKNEEIIKFLFDFYEEPINQQALNIASPGLLNVIIKAKEKQLGEKEMNKLIITLTKYFLRITSRETPFGFFAGCSTGKFSDHSNFTVSNKIDHSIATRPDMHFMCQLFKQIMESEHIRSSTNYRLNTSLFSLGKNYRYIESKFNGSSKKFEISEVPKSEIIDKVIDQSKKEISYIKLINSVKELEPNLGNEEIEFFIDELIENQIIIPTIEPTVSGSFYLDFLLEKLTEIQEQNKETVKLYNLLSEIKKNFGQRSLNDFNFTKLLDKVSEIEGLNFKIDPKMFVQVDLYISNKSNLIDDSIQANVKDGFYALSKLWTSFQNKNLTKFIEDFVSRYGEEEVCLLEALDPEYGIGYGHNINIEDLGEYTGQIPFFISNKNGELFNWNPTFDLMLRKLIEATSNKEYEIKLTSADLKELKSNDELFDFSTLSAVSNIFNENGISKVHVSSIWGPSAAKILGRFANDNNAIKKTIETINEKENGLVSEDWIFAEIVHLPGSRVGNILLRPDITQYEIPYLTNSSKKEDNQIVPNDIYISISGNKVVLRSKKLNKFIIPKLTNAHNYQNTTLPIYHFLCDMSAHNWIQGIQFNWGPLESTYKFLPRVTYKGAIISLAKWHFSSNELKNALTNQNLEEFAKWKKKYSLPSLVTMDEGDNKLLIDFDNKLIRNILVESLKNKSKIQLTEFIHDSKNAIVRDTSGQGFASQFVFTLTNNSDVYLPQINKDYSSINGVKRNFNIGDEWIFYKFYCGPNFSDSILIEFISPLINQLKQNNFMKKWFFIRYFDEKGYHLRIRIEPSDKSYFSIINNIVNEIGEKLINDRLISDYNLSVYRRELERYGSKYINLVESLFYFESDLILAILAKLDFETLEQKKWNFATMLLNQILENFKCNIEEKHMILLNLSDNFGKEFGKNKFTIKKLNKLYRNIRNDLNSVLKSNQFDDKELEIIKLAIDNYSNRSLVTIQSMVSISSNRNELTNLLYSFLHMAMNRIFKNSQRKYEMVIYDVLNQFYKSELAKIKYN